MKQFFLVIFFFHLFIPLAQSESWDSGVKTLEPSYHNRSWRYQGWAILYRRNDPRFYCDHYQKNEARRRAADTALNNCYYSGRYNCRIISSWIFANGYLGYIDGIYYGYGCAAEATAEGRH